MNNNDAGSFLLEQREL